MLFTNGKGLNTEVEPSLLVKMVHCVNFQLCLCILITTSGSTMSALNSIILAVGVVWACLTASVGAVAVSVPHPFTLTAAHLVMFTFSQQPCLLVCFPGFKGSKGAGLGLHRSEFSTTSLLCLSDVYGEMRMIVFLSNMNKHLVYLMTCTF